MAGLGNQWDDPRCNSSRGCCFKLRKMSQKLSWKSLNLYATPRGFQGPLPATHYPNKICVIIWGCWRPKCQKFSKRKRVTSKSVQKKGNSSASLRRFAKNSWPQHVWTLQFRGLMLVWSEPTGCCFLQKIIRRPFLAQNLEKTSSSHYRNYTKDSMETQLLRRKIKGHLLETKSQKGPSRFASEDCNTCREDISCKVPDAKLSSTRDLWYDKPGRTWPHSSPSKSSLRAPLWWATRMPFMLNERIQVIFHPSLWQVDIQRVGTANVAIFYICTACTSQPPTLSKTSKTKTPTWHVSRVP